MASRHPTSRSPVGGARKNLPNLTSEGRHNVLENTHHLYGVGGRKMQLKKFYANTLVVEWCLCLSLIHTHAYGVGGRKMQLEKFYANTLVVEWYLRLS